MQKEKAIFNWSGGKDSALCLYKLQQAAKYDIAGLLTTVNAEYQRISMHGVRVALLDKQAASLGLPSMKILLPESPTMESYEQVMNETLMKLKSDGISASVFGDIFLEDLRTYRENKLAQTGIKGIFPLWKKPTIELIHEFIDLGFKTITTCVNEKYLDRSFVGRIIDHDFLNELPPNVDPCGEYGEFHTFVFDGPNFKEPIAFNKGEIVYRSYPAPKETQTTTYDCAADGTKEPENYGFWYCDLV
jgi:uncharacterized protein (TIGR00290 family)